MRRSTLGLDLGPPRGDSFLQIDVAAIDGHRRPSTVIDTSLDLDGICAHLRPATR